jgi:hypothetical protein
LAKFHDGSLSQKFPEHPTGSTSIAHLSRFQEWSSHLAVHELLPLHDAYGAAGVDGGPVTEEEQLVVENRLVPVPLLVFQNLGCAFDQLQGAVIGKQVEAPRIQIQVLRALHELTRLQNAEEFGKVG